MVNAALGMAVEGWRPTDPQRPTARSARRAAKLAPSLGSVADAFDTAMVESFWARMQTELLDIWRWRTRMGLRLAPRADGLPLEDPFSEQARTCRSIRSRIVVSYV
jgi:hypothetical protein